MTTGKEHLKKLIGTMTESELDTLMLRLELSEARAKIEKLEAHNKALSSTIRNQPVPERNTIMSREKTARPASLTEASTKLAKAMTSFDAIASEAVDEADKGDLSRAAALVKEGHPLMLALKDAYNAFYGQVNTAASKAKAAAAAAEAKPKGEKKSKGKEAPEAKTGGKAEGDDAEEV